MKKLLLIMGDLATGKSTFAKVLSGRYGAVLFCKDDLKEVLGDTLGYSNREENLRLSRGAAELMGLIFRQFGEVGKDLILESNFRIGELEMLHKLAKEKDYQVLTLVLRGDVALLHGRYLNRMHNENRPAVHLCEQFNTLEGFGAYLESLRSPSVPGEAVYIDANDFGYQSDSGLLAVMDGFMGFSMGKV